MNKQDIRLAYRHKRLQLSEHEISEMSVALANRLLDLPIWHATYFHVFMPIAEQKEVDTECILHLLAGKDKAIIVSKSNFETREMTHFLLTDDTRFKKNAYHIPEPVAGIEVPVGKIEVVFVPLLAFDQGGNRVGYGKGFYDRFLAQCNPETLKIGLSFFDAVKSVQDVFESDIKLDYCVTPQKVYTF